MTKIIPPNWKEISKIKNYKKRDFNNLLKKYIENKKEVYKKIKALKKEERNFLNTVLALENCDQDFDNIFNQIGVYSITHKNKEYRDLASLFEKELSQKSVDLEYDKDLWKAVLEYREGNYKKEKKQLDNKYGIGSVKLFEDIYKGYKRMGFDLSKIKQNKLKNNLKNLAKLSIDFRKNIDEYRDHILCSEEEIKGLPENFVSTLEKVGGKYKITLDYPNFGPYMQYADSREKRKELTDKNYQKGGEKNIKILSKIIKFRDENAKILGYKNHVDFKTENRMAKSEKNVRDFSDSLIKKLKPKSDKEIIELNNFAKKNLPLYKNLKKIEYFDVSYVANKMKDKKYSYDSAKLKEYFELERVLKITFQIFGELFGFAVKEVLEKEKRNILVDKEVRIYEFKDLKTKKLISYLILDLFPREGKYGHACSSEFITGKEDKQDRVIPVNELICNFTRPTKNLPSLLSLGEVETLFHELGHAFHFMFTKCVHSSQAGYSVVWDFVETPSQLLENFLFEENNLKKLAIHYKTKKPLDKNIIEKIKESRNFLNSGNYLAQFIMVLLDLDLHSNKVKPENSAKYFNELKKKYLKDELPKDAIFPARFGHLMNYDAGYYSYMWALVYADDFYREFAKVSASAPASARQRKMREVGERYRKEILEVGGSREEIESVKKFLKRNPNNKAFLEKIK